MDAEKSNEVSETVMENEVASKVETPDESTQPENPPAAEEEPGQSAVNGDNSEVPNEKETEEPVATENVTPSEEKPETKDDDSSPKEQDESSEKISDPVAALDAETPENTKQQPEPENDPEPLAESIPEPEPEKSAESVPEAEPREQTSPKPVDTQPPSQEDAERGLETTMEANSDVAAEPKEVGEAAGTVLVTEAAAVKVEAPAEDGQPAEKDKSEEKEAQAAAELEQKEEDPTPASGSLSFALLEQQQTKDALRISRTLVVLRGLPGSGKSFLARAIADAYQDHCSIISADDHGIKPESPSADGYQALDEAVVARCSDAAASSSVLIVVDDTNHTQDRLARLGEIAVQNHLVAVFLEAQTQWSRDVAELSKKTRRGLQEAQLEAMKAPLEEVTLPLFFGWFLLSSVQEKVPCTSMDFLKTLDTLEAFKKHLVDFTGKAEKEVDLEQYFKPQGALHCTTKFCNYGKAEGAKEYAENPAVKESYGSAFELSLTALFVTPRTVGARVSLTDEQLKLWPADAEKEAASVVPAAASLPLGSRAHITLGCAEGVEPVQTGLDLLEILALQQEGQEGEPAEEMELGSLKYYGEGRWLLSLREPVCAPACFSSFYGPKESEPTKKEPEKKKKPKCSIL